MNYSAVGNLVDLPTISETYKTKDYINLFKSNDVS
jgi:transcription initiation factor TFIID subunit 7